MKAIMMSINPKWVAKILNGEKTIEIRKRFPSDYIGWVYIYCTKDKPLFVCKDSKGIVVKLHDSKKNVLEQLCVNGKVVARFWCDKVEHIEYETCSRDISGWWKDNGKMFNHKDACLTYVEMFNYIGSGEGYAIRITKLEIFDKPMQIKDLVRPCKEPIDYCGESCLECPYAVLSQYSDYDDALPLGDMKKVERCLLITKLKAPQSWCYVEI